MNNLKINRLISFILTSSILISSIQVNAFDNAKLYRKKVMDNFKEEQYTNIFQKSNVLLGTNVNFFETQNKIGEIQNSLSGSIQRKNELLSQKESIDERIISLQDAISAVDEDISQSQKQIVLYNQDILSTNKQVEDFRIQIIQINKQIRENKEVLFDYIAHIYKKQNMVVLSGEKDIDALKTVFLTSGSLGDLLSELHFSSVLEITGQMLIEKHRKLIKDLFVKQLNLKTYSQNLIELRKKEVAAKQELLEKRAFRERILEYSKGKQELFEKYIADQSKEDLGFKIRLIRNKIELKEQKQKFLADYNCGYINLDKLDELTLIENANLANTGSTDGSGSENKENFCLKLNKILLAESQLNPMDSSKTNVLSWPVPPLNGLSAYYKDRSYEADVGTTHEAIDIRTPQGTPVVAPADGYVTFLKSPTDETYSYIALKHANGFITVYGHINELLVNEFDFVKAGTVFAKSGGEFGTNGAGYMTTGPHLHFEVYKDKEYVDPLSYLDLDDLTIDKLPPEQKYLYKFYADYKAKYGVDYTGEDPNIDNLMVLNGETEIDRQKDLLSRYASPDFNNWDIWVEEATEGNIDPSFMMCIGLAESSLGNHLKTAYNVGNVGNTDSGGTRDFENPRSGIYWIAKTLNNPFLGDYKTMDKLSRYGNKDGSIYASASVNWQNNIVKCLTALKKQYIPDDFKFRTN